MGLARRVPASWERETNPSLLFAGCPTLRPTFGFGHRCERVRSSSGPLISTGSSRTLTSEPPAGGLPGVRQLREMVAGVVARTATLVRLRVGSRRKRLPGKSYFSSGRRLAFSRALAASASHRGPGHEDGWDAFRCRQGALTVREHEVMTTSKPGSTRSAQARRLEREILLCDSREFTAATGGIH